MNRFITVAWLIAYVLIAVYAGWGVLAAVMVVQAALGLWLGIRALRRAKNNLLVGIEVVEISPEHIELR